MIGRRLIAAGRRIAYASLHYAHGCGLGVEARARVASGTARLMPLPPPRSGLPSSDD